MDVHSAKQWVSIWVICLLICVLALPVIAIPQIIRSGKCTTDLPLSILWHHDLLAPSFGSAAVGDIDGDGKPEIVFGTYFNDESIYALNAENGSVLWSYDTGGCNDASVAIADVNQDGTLEVIACGSSMCMVYCFIGATGIVEWSRYTGHCIDSPPAVADVDGDGKLEVVVGTFEGYVFCLAGEDGLVKWQKNLGTNSYIQSCPTILDCEGNGMLDVVVAQWEGTCRVYALRGVNGSTLWYSSAPTDSMYHGPSFGDIDGDGLPELAIGCYDHHVYVLNAEDGSVCWSYTALQYVGAPTCLADLNNDSYLEVIFVSYNIVGVLSHTGSLLWSITVGGNVFRGVAISDVNGDGILDLIFGCDDGKLRAVRGDIGASIWTYDLQADYGAPFPMDHAPVLADFNSDEKLELFVVGGHGESTHPENNYGRAYMLSAGNGTGAGWPMFHHDLVHSGRFYEDNTPPTPNPETWVTIPFATSQTSISMTATTATDPSTPVQYYFDETSGNAGGTDSGWQTSSTYSDTGLTCETTYTYRVQTRDALGNTGSWSTSQSATTNPCGDTTPPTPNPETWATVPYATGQTSISMTATTATDPSTPVQYYFDETSGNAGGTDSGWQLSSSYTNTGLTCGTTYTYKVQTRDTLGNTGLWSISQSATTLACSTEQLDQQQTIQNYYNMVYGTRWGGQSFKPTKTTLTRVELYIKKVGSPPDITLGVRSSLTGADLTSVSVVASSIPTTMSWVNFDFSDLAVNTGNMYYLVLRTTGGTSANCYYWGYGNINPYANGVYWFSFNSGSTWTQYATYDFCFKTYGYSADTTPPTPNPSTWTTVPYAVNSTSISMTATTAADPSTPVQYYFDETSGNPGGSDSGWQTSNSYIDTVLTCGTTYTYRVQTRDAVGNTGSWSTSESTTPPCPDMTPPTPNPSTWATLPYGSSTTSISMTATTATDPSPPVEYYFDETSGNAGGTDSGWQTSSSYTDTGLTTGMPYTYRVQARDAAGNTGFWSTSESATPQVDTTPPTPNPSTWATVPYGTTSTSISMAATTATDLSPPVEYYFDETSGNPGGSDSSWQTSNTYSDTGLTCGTTYTYRVQTRDAVGNTGSWSISESAIPPCQDTTPPTPNPSTWAILPHATSRTSISMTATTAIDPSLPVEYYFDETSGNPGGSDSGWQTSSTYSDTGLTCGTTYTYRVQTRDAVGNTGSWSTSQSATTDACPSEELDQQQTTLTYNNMIFAARWGAQSFKPTKTTLTRVEFYVKKVGSPPSALTVSVRNALTGIDLTSVLVPASSIPTTSSWVNFDFTDLSVTPGSTYYLVVRTMGGTSANCYYWSYGTGNPYANGLYSFSFDGGSTWMNYATYDFCFKTYGYT